VIRLLLVLLLTLAACAQEQDRINTDNPSISTSSYTVGKGVVQWEASFDYSSGKTAPRANRRRLGTEDDFDELDGEDENEADFYSLPQLFRIGLSDDFELRIGHGGLAFQSRRMGLDDLSVGFKWNFYDDGRLAMGVTTSTVVPTGTTGFRSPLVLPAGVFTLDYELDAENSVGFNLGGGLGVDNDVTFGQGLVTFDYMHDFGEDVSGYVELAFDGPGTVGGPLETTVDAGLSFFMTDDFVVNLAVFRGLSNTGADWGATIGFGARL